MPVRAGTTQRQLQRRRVSCVSGGNWFSVQPSNSALTLLWGTLLVAPTKARSLKQVTLPIIGQDWALP
jgi:hypothetical protein